MSKKQWYVIEVECVKEHCTLTCTVGEKFIVAKIKSKGLAYSTAKHLQDTLYKNNCIVRVL